MLRSFRRTAATAAREPLVASAALRRCLATIVEACGSEASEVDIVSDPGGDNVVWMCLSNSLPTGRRTGELPVYQVCHGRGMSALASRRALTAAL